MKFRSLILVGAAFAALSFAASADPVTDAARVAGTIGEQPDGYVGVVAGQNPSAEVRAHMDQMNILRRTSFAQRAQTRGVSVNEMAAAFACLTYSELRVGEHYRGEDGRWRQRTASSPVVMPSFCPR